MHGNPSPALVSRICRQMGITPILDVAPWVPASNLKWQRHRSHALPSHSGLGIIRSLVSFFEQRLKLKLLGKGQIVIVWLPLRFNRPPVQAASRHRKTR